MSNPVRQQAILRLVRDRAISTQGELVEALREEGHDVVQTTISRDIQELGLTKVRAPSGRLVYAAPGADDADRLRAIGVAMRRYATGVERAGPLVVVTTPSGYASALAQAIDEGGHPGIAGTIAGDNTIFLAPRDGTSARGAGHRAARAPIGLAGPGAPSDCVARRTRRLGGSTRGRYSGRSRARLRPREPPAEFARLRASTAGEESLGQLRPRERTPSGICPRRRRGIRAAGIRSCGFPLANKKVRRPPGGTAVSVMLGRVGAV